MENNNKESFQLLAANSENSSGSEIQEFSLPPPRKSKRLKRRQRGRLSRDGSSSRESSISSGPCCCCCGVGPKSKIWRIGIGVSILGAWMLAISWVALSTHGDVASLDAKLQSVSSSSDGVSNELYQCRSMSRQLQLNQSHITAQIDNLTLYINNITNELHIVTMGLNEVQKRVKEAPQLVDVPKQLSDLSTSVANLGSQISDLKTTASQLQGQNSNFVTNISQLQAVEDMLNATILNQMNAQSTGHGQTSEEIKEAEKAKADVIQKIQDQIIGLSGNITQVNTSLTQGLKWNSDDVNKYRKIVEGIQDSSQNMSARVTTLEGQCNAFNIKQIDFDKNLTQLNYLVSGTGSRTAQLETRVGKLQDMYGELQANIQTRIDHLEPSATLASTSKPTVKPTVSSSTSAPSPPLVNVSTSSVPIAAEG